MKGVAALFVFSFFVFGETLLLNPSNSTGTVLTPHNFQQLLDLLIEEKKLRSELETHVDVLEQKILENVAALQTFTQAFAKEQSNRNQLQRSYTRLSLDFHNLSIEHAVLMEKHKHLQKGLYNITHESESRLNEIDFNIRNLTQTTEESVLRENESEHRINEILANITTLASGIESQDLLMKGFQSNVRATNASVQLALSHYRGDIGDLKLKTEHKSGFTYKEPTDGTANGTITFNSKGKIADISNDFDRLSGRFTCRYSGVYYFSLSLVKVKTPGKSYTSVTCAIFKNDVNTGAKAYTDPTDDDTDKGSYEGSAFVVLHLNKGDHVSLGDCSSASSLDASTSFSGFLINAD